MRKPKDIKLETGYAGFVTKNETLWGYLVYIGGNGSSGEHDQIQFEDKKDVKKLAIYLTKVANYLEDK